MVFTNTSGSTSVFYTFIFLFCVIYVVSVGRWEVETFHVEIRSSFSSSNEAIFSMVTLAQDPNTCPSSFASATKELNYLVKSQSQHWGKSGKIVMKEETSATLHRPLPGSPCTHSISRTVQSLPSGGTADLGWILMAEEFCFANYSEECDSLVKLHNHSPSQSGCGH